MTRTAAESTERVRNLLAAFLVGAFVAALPVFTFNTIPDGNRDIITYMVGQLSGMATTALGFYFINKVGQDAADAVKAENTGKFADAIKAVAVSTGVVTDDPTVIRDGDPVTVTKNEETEDVVDQDRT